MKSTQLSSLLGYRNTAHRLLRHVIFWSLFVVYNVAVWGAYKDNVQQTFLFEIYFLFAKMVMSYATIYYLIPRFLLPKRYKAFLLWFLIGLLITGIINRLITYYVVYPISYPEGVGSTFLNIKLFFEITIIFNSVAMVVVIKLLQYWYETEDLRTQLAQEKSAAELKLLKSQLHPHFLFNTLNSLYALALEKSSIAPDIVLKLSSLLHYMLYDCNKPLVPFEKEVAYLENYISLEQLRYGKKLSLSYETNGKFEGHSIAPLMLLPFVENAFKHGVSQHTTAPWIRMNLSVDKQQLYMQLENSIPIGSEVNRAASESENAYTQGVGLKNVKKRLALLYKDRHSLTITENDSFLINLKLYLD